MERMVVRLSSKGQLVIPKKLRDRLGLKRGSKLLLWREGERIVLLPTNKFGSETKGMAKGTYGKSPKQVERYLKKERESWE